MKLTIFSRLIIGFLILAVLVTAVSVYSILQLSEVNKVTRSIILADNSLLDVYKKLTDELLSETRNEKKYVIMQDNAFYDSYRKAKEDFNQHLFEAILLAEPAEMTDLLYKVNRLHYQFNILFMEEFEYLVNTRQYAKEWYKNEKEKTANAILEELKFLGFLSEKNVINKVRNLSEMGIRASKIAIIITVAALLFGLILSAFITRSITIPLSAMKKKTREIATGDLDSNLKITTPPEMAELADAFNYMSRKLKEVDTMKSDFFSLMSHELRTPLTSIKEGTNMMLEGLGGELTDKQQRLLGIIAEESNRLIGLVNSLLDLSKMEAGMMAYHLTEADLNLLVQQAVQEIIPLAESKNILIEKETSTALPPVAVDSERVLQALRNILGNAIKFTSDDGRVKISVHPVTEGVQVSISDTGPGIAKEDLSRIFLKFHQVAPAGTHKFKGTGLGLTTVEHIISAHGGKIWVESEVGHGSTFFFILPA